MPWGIQKLHLKHYTESLADIYHHDENVSGTVILPANLSRRERQNQHPASNEVINQTQSYKESEESWLRSSWV